MQNRVRISFQPYIINIAVPHNNAGFRELGLKYRKMQFFADTYNPDRFTLNRTDLHYWLKRAFKLNNELRAK